MKKILSILLVTAVLLCNTIPFAYADNQSLFEWEFNVLNALDIMTVENSDEEYDGSILVSRKEAASIAVKLLVGDSVGDGKIYDDVEDDAYSEYIYTAASLNLMRGDGTLFRPDDAVSVVEFAAVLERVLNYEKTAISSGGFPEGYIAMANRHDMLDQLSVSWTDEVTRDTAARMVYNILDVELFEDSTSADGIARIGDDTILSKKDIYFGKGVVEANHYTRSEISKNSILIDGVQFDCGMLSAFDLTGYNVQYYYRELDDVGKQLLFIEKTKKNTEIVIEDTYNTEYEDFEYTYIDENNRQKKAKINKNTEIIYNDASIKSGFSRYIPDCGNIKLIDNDDDNVYEFIVINEYEHIICSAVDLQKGFIYDKFDQSKKINLNNGDVKIYDMSGKITDASAITADDTLCVKKSYSQSVDGLTQIYIGEKQKTGKVTNILSSQNDTAKIYIDEQEYELCKNVAYDSSVFGVGDLVVYYLGINNELVNVSKDGAASINNLGYVNKCFYNEEDQQFYLRMFAIDGTFETYVLDDKTRIVSDGESRKIDTFSAEEYRNRLLYKICMYKFNSEGKINYLEVSPDYVADSDKEYVGLHQTAKAQKGIWLQNLPILGSSKILLDKNCIAFSIPEDKDKEDRYKVGIAKENMQNKADTEITLDIYQTRNSDETMISDVIVGTDIFNSASGDPYHMILVSSISEVYNENEEDLAYKVKGLYKGKEVAYNTKDKELIDSNNIVPGDLISVGLSDTADITSVIKRFDYSTKTTYNNKQQASNPTGWMDSAEYKLAYGKAFNRLGDGLEMVIGDAPDYTNYDKSLREVMNTSRNTWVYIYDSERKISELGTINDVKTYSQYGADCDTIIMGWCEWAFSQIVVLYR